MTQETAAHTGAEQARIGWSVEAFARFWDAPDPELVAPVLTDDVAGYWPGSDEPVRGPAAYTKAIADVIEAIPDVRLEVAEHATNGEYTFIRWIMHATGANGPFTLSGIDRIRLRDGLVAENVIRFDRAHLEALLGRDAPVA